MKDIKKIAIIRTDKIGDVILTLPLVKAIKNFLPNSIIDFIAQDYTLPLIKFNKYLDNTFSIPTKFKDKYLFFKKSNYDAIITVKPEFDIALATFLAKIPIRVGTAYRFYSFLFNHKIYHHRKEALKNELEYNFDLLTPFGYNFNPNFENIDYGLQIPQDLITHIKNDILANTNYNSNYKTIIVHPGSGKSSLDLPIDKFKSLTEKLSHLSNINIIVTGNHSEKIICDAISHPNTINLAGKLNLEEFTALCSIGDILISNSTGPIHIAAALGKWTVGFYPLVKECSITRWGPYTKKRFLFTPNNNCSHSTLDECRKNKCMDTINIDEVYNTIFELINKI